MFKLNYPSSLHLNYTGLTLRPHSDTIRHCGCPVALPMSLSLSEMNKARTHQVKYQSSVHESNWIASATVKGFKCLIGGNNVPSGYVFPNIGSSISTAGCRVFFWTSLQPAVLQPKHTSPQMNGKTCVFDAAPDCV